ncbi:hypothetical protein Agub_g14340, partial [Astrephomene gubernaculifera]
FTCLARLAARQANSAAKDAEEEQQQALREGAGAGVAEEQQQQQEQLPYTGNPYSAALCACLSPLTAWLASPGCTAADLIEALRPLRTARRLFPGSPPDRTPTPTPPLEGGTTHLSSTTAANPAAACPTSSPTSSP